MLESIRPYFGLSKLLTTRNVRLNFVPKCGGETATRQTGNYADQKCHFKNDNNSCQLNGSGNGVVFIETTKIRTRISGRQQFWKDQNKAEWTLDKMKEMNSSMY